MGDVKWASRWVCVSGHPVLLGVGRKACAYVIGCMGVSVCHRGSYSISSLHQKWARRSFLLAQWTRTLCVAVRRTSTRNIGMMIFSSARTAASASMARGKSHVSMAFPTPAPSSLQGQALSQDEGLHLSAPLPHEAALPILPAAAVCGRTFTLAIYPSPSWLSFLCSGCRAVLLKLCCLSPHRQGKTEHRMCLPQGVLPKRQRMCVL